MPGVDAANEAERVVDKYIWKQLHEVNVLHQELASLYQTNSGDDRRRDALWRAIEEREATLVQAGIDIY